MIQDEPADLEALESRIARVRSLVDRAAEKADRSSQEITIVAVSKTFSRSAVDLAYGAGLRVFGENRVQEAKAKFESSLPNNATLRMIGHLQSNKVRQAIPLFSCVDSVDRLSLVDALSREACRGKLLLPVLVQVNVSGESGKSGCACGEAEALVTRIRESAHLRCDGLMTIAPLVTDAAEARPAFIALRELRDHLQQRLSIPLPVLSMGMSNDFEVAIAEGATHIRLGRAIFGSR